MPDDGSAPSTPLWPLPKFYFQVRWNSQLMSFQEVSGLDAEVQSIEYRHGDSMAFSTIRMPGLRKVGNVTLKKGVFRNDNRFWDWFNQVKMNKIKRVPVTISLMDKSGATAMVWTLNNAWPTKITGSDLKSDGNEVAVETLEIAYESLTVSQGRLP